MTIAPAMESIRLTPQQEAEALELASIRRAARALKEREDALRDKIKDDLDSAGVGIGVGSNGEPLVVVTETIRRNVSGKTLEARYPEVYADIATTTPVAQVRVTVPTAIPKV